MRLFPLLSRWLRADTIQNDRSASAKLLLLLSRRYPALARAIRQRLQQTPAVEIVGIDRVEVATDHVWGAKLDAAHPGNLGQYSVTLTGWAVTRSVPVRDIRVYSDQMLVASGTLDRKHPAVAKHLPEVPEPEQSGFLIRVNTLGLPPHFELTVVAVLKNRANIPLGTVHCKQNLVQVGFRPTLNPILVTFFGRTGSTWLMRLLLEHPKILVYPRYPYEIRPMRYWLHMLRVLSAAADHRYSTKPTGFMKNENWIGSNPYLPLLKADPSFHRWLGQQYTEKLAQFCLESVETFYQHIARIAGRGNAVYFAEKIHPEVATGLLRQLYPRLCEIILVRDPRDILASVISFNAKRGKVGFGYSQYNNPVEYLTYLKARMAIQAQMYQANPEHSYLLRYEDLILRPTETLTGLLTYLGLDASPATVAGMLERASQDNEQMQRHRTSESPAQSIGRWKRDLPPELQESARSVLGDVLKTLGYEV